MRIEELSIGDWVCAKLAKWESDDADMTPPLQVKRINGIERHNLYVDLFNPSNNTIEHSAFVEDLIPIPLTPEILEKNGFKIDRLSGWHIYETQNGLRTTVWLGKNRDGKIEVSSQSIFDLETYECFLRVELNNIAVHDLLHALHLAGIEKEIEL